MTYQRFEDLPVWNDAVALAVDLFEFTEQRDLRRKGDIANQLDRAALSISNNIAEGFERGTKEELLTFLYYARGSAGEVRSVLHVMSRLAMMKDYKSQITDFIKRATGISRQIGAWADSLQNSDARGQRYQTDSSRRAAEQKKRSDDFMAKLRAANPYAPKSES